MILEDTTLRRLAYEQRIVQPFSPHAVQPASIDLHLGTSFRVLKEHRHGVIDLANVPDHDELTELVEVKLGAEFVIHPGELVLGSTLEEVYIPPDIAMYLDGKSSLGRLGLTVHVTAGYFDPGFKGIPTLELVNLSRIPIVLRPGFAICQSRWMKMHDVPSELYQGRYQGDKAATGSRYGRG